MKCEVVVGPISVYGYMGAYSEEKILGKEYIINVYYSYNCYDAATNDDLYKSINYTEIVSIVKDIVENSKDNLIETTAYKIKLKIDDTFSNIENLFVEIEKRNPPVSGVGCFKIKI